ncbi:MAG: hypothetical protein HUJ53_02030 [Holdemanella sp.]|nr:hypothetical protein [Holdemanella sp.]
MAAVWIEDIVEAFEDLNANWKPYVNKESGEVVFMPLSQQDMDECSKEEKEIFSNIDNLSEYIPLPEQKELREFDIMEEYAQETINKGMQKRLLSALRMNKPFRNFRAQLRLLGLEDDYNQYRYMIFASKARTWCLQHAIPFQVESDEIKDYFKEIEEDERKEKELEDFDDSFGEFTYEEEYDDYFE